MIRVLTVLAVLAMLQAGVSAEEPTRQPDPQALKRMSLEELMQVDVTLVSRRPEAIGRAAAAISVISGDDIRRSGVTTIPDALALATGVHVARFNNGTWAVSARGFNATTANKLLVMVDGRDEVTPLFTGVFWNMLDYVLEDIERIEVIRGPGAALWGANAVNGVVNIVTRHSRETRGTLVSVGTGNEDPALIEVRHGGGSERLSYRAYGKYASRDDQRLAGGAAGDDGRRRGQVGLRLDASRGSNDWLLKADLFHSRDQFIDRGDGEFTLAAVQASWARRVSPSGQVRATSYYRREYRNVPQQLTHTLDTIDIEVQHSGRLGVRHDFIWGAGYRYNHDSTEGTPAIRFDPPDRSYPLYSAFAQTESTVLADALFLTAALKLEHNAFSGPDWQPNLRVRWQRSPSQMVWGSVARAVRRPTRFEDDIQSGSVNGVPQIRGGDAFESEVMTGWEAGYRLGARARLSLDATVFSQHYDRLRSLEAPVTGIIPITIGNGLTATSRGLELTAVFDALPRVRTYASYAFLRTDIGRAADSRDVGQGVPEGNDPSHLFGVRAAFDATDTVDVDAWLRRVGSLPNPPVPAYTELNARIGWRLRPGIELALIGQDLLHGRHPEFGAPTPTRVEFERSLRATVTFRR